MEMLSIEKLRFIWLLIMSLCPILCFPSQTSSPSMSPLEKILYDRVSMLEELITRAGLKSNLTENSSANASIPTIIDTVGTQNNHQGNISSSSFNSNVEQVNFKATQLINTTSHEQINMELGSDLSSLQRPVSTKLLSPDTKSSAMSKLQRSKNYATSKVLTPGNATWKLQIPEKNSDSNDSPSSGLVQLGHPSAHSCGIIDSMTKRIRQMRILMSSTEKYIPVLLNWLIYFHVICPDRSMIYFLCLDKATELSMQKYGLQCSHVYHTSGSNNKLWLTRVRIAKQLLDQGFDVLMSDSDALWLRNPFAVMDMHPQADIISSRASFPEDVMKVLGSTLCMGFVYVKSKQVTKDLWEELADLMAKQPKPDDQKSINQLLLKRGLSYAGVRQSPDDQRVAAGSFTVRGNTGFVVLLPNFQYRRICDGIKLPEIHKSIVVHCLTEKKGEVKEKACKFLGLWAVKERWTEVAFNHSTDDFLQSIVVSTHRHVGHRRLIGDYVCAQHEGQLREQHRQQQQQQQQQRFLSVSSFTTAHKVVHYTYGDEMHPTRALAAPLAQEVIVPIEIDRTVVAAGLSPNISYLSQPNHYNSRNSSRSGSLRGHQQPIAQTSSMVNSVSAPGNDLVIDSSPQTTQHTQFLSVGNVDMVLRHLPVSSMQCESRVLEPVCNLTSTSSVADHVLCEEIVSSQPSYMN